jgi:hypothetical protein
VGSEGARRWESRRGSAAGAPQECGRTDMAGRLGDHGILARSASAAPRSVSVTGWHSRRWVTGEGGTVGAAVLRPPRQTRTRRCAVSADAACGTHRADGAAGRCGAAGIRATRPPHTQAAAKLLETPQVMRTFYCAETQHCPRPMQPESGCGLPQEKGGAPDRQGNNPGGEVPQGAAVARECANLRRAELPTPPAERPKCLRLAAAAIVRPAQRRIIRGGGRWNRRYFWADGGGKVREVYKR